MQIIFTNPKSKLKGHVVCIIDNVQTMTVQELAEEIEYQANLGNDYHYKRDEIITKGE